MLLAPSGVSRLADQTDVYTGVRSGLPAASTKTFAFCDDTGEILKSDGTTWKSFSGAQRTVAIVNRATNTSISSGVFTNIVCTTRRYDPSLLYNTSSGVYTVPYDGVYDIRGVVRPADDAPIGANFLCAIHTANGESLGEAWEVTVDNTQNANDRNTAHMSALFDFTAGQQIRLVSYTDKSGGITIQTGFLSIALYCIK